MSHFSCEECGRTQVDVDGVGYVSGCSHYPPEHSRFVTVSFGGDEPSVKAFYAGAFYKSVESMNQGRAVHPVEWTDLESAKGGE